jgi:hypothetical protein
MVVFRVTLPLLRHAELDSASQDETLKRVQGDVEKKRDPEINSG